MIRNLLIALLALSFAPLAQANYVGSETQYFNPTPDNLDFFTVHSSRTLPKGTMKTTLFFDYAENLNYSSPFLENNVMQAQLGFAMGLTEKISFSLAGSGILLYDNETGSKYTTDNFTYVRSSIKYSFCNCEEGGFAIIGDVGVGLMDPDVFVGDGTDLGLAVTLAYSKRVTDAVMFAANLGYRYRNSEKPDPGTAMNTPSYAAVMAGALANGDTRSGSDVLASVGLNFAMSDRLTGVTEIYSQLPTDQFFDFTVDSDSYDQKGAELLVGANYNLNDKMDIGFGGTLGVFSQAQNADWRVFAGLGYYFGGAYEDAAFAMAGSRSAPKPVKVVKEAKPEKKETPKLEDAPSIKEFDITAKFALGSANLSEEAKGQLNKAGDFLKHHKNYRMVFIEGHTDSQGPEEYNKLLSQRRAQMAKVYLSRTYNIPSEKIQSVGFGETAPVADNASAAGRAKNRRVIIKIK